MEERKELEEAIRRLEAQRDTLGDAAVEAALSGLQQRMAALDNAKTKTGRPPAKSRPAGERRVVTVLFCDVAGSTRLAEGMDPESWTEIMNAAFAHLLEPIERYGGTVARLMGDAVLAFFGAPTAHEDDPQRAVLAGLAIIEGISPFRERLLSEKGIDFNVRVGINTGLVVVGDVGSEASAEYTAMGDAVNIAARMEQTAQPGTVQIAQETYTLVAPLFECQALGGIRVKGKSKPVPAYQVVARKTKPGSLRGLGGHGITSPLVGREREFAAALGALSRLMEGRGGILTVLGEAGIGKSRLLTELRASIVAQVDKGPADRSPLASFGSRLAWLEGGTLSYGQSISYWPFQEILRSQAGINEDDDEGKAWHKLTTCVRELFGQETPEILPYMASVLALEVSDEYAERVQFLDGEELRRQVYRASRLFFQRLAEKTPLVLLFDDLHWMDASSAGLLEHLLPLVEGVPVLFCTLSRPDGATAAERLRAIAKEEYGHRFTYIELRPLSANDSNELVHNLLDIDGLPTHVRQMMVRKADGNPFFLEEIVRDLIEAGALVHNPSTGRWRATAAAEKVTVPDTIQGLIMTRIDRLEDDLKRVLRRAAVIGRSFLYRILDAVLEDEEELEDRLDQLQRTELIQKKQQIPELEYIFRHALAQEAAYESILLQERREMHSRVGQAIETLMAERIDEFYGLLAYHYTAAERWDRAQEYLFKAGDQAGRMAADAEALSHYQQAMEAYTLVRGDAWEPIERARLERKIGGALYRLGEHMQARHYLERALALLGEELPSSRWGMRLAIARALITQFFHRSLPRLYVRPMGGSLDPVAEEIYLASMALGGVEFLSNTARYLLLHLRALNTSERRGYAYGSATLAANMGLGAAAIGRVRIAEMYFRQSARYRAQIKPYRPVPELEIGIASLNNTLADFEKMEEYTLRGMEIAQGAGDLRVWGIGKVNLVWSYWGRARYDEAMEETQELLRSAEESSDRQLEAWSFLALGSIQQRRGLVEEAVVSHQRAYEIAEELPDWATLTGAAGWMGRAYLVMEKVDEALEIMEYTRDEFWARTSNFGAYVYLGNGLARAYLAKVEGSDHESRGVWLSKAKVECRRALKGGRHLQMARADALLVRGRYEWLGGKPRAAQNWWGRALAHARDSGMRYEEGMTHLEIGRRLGDREHLQKAYLILETIGAEAGLESAKAALAELSYN